MEKNILFYIETKCIAIDKATANDAHLSIHELARR